MKPCITLLGTGGPRPDAARGATSLLLQAGDETILIDAGRGTARALASLGVRLGSISPMLITHHHYDHIGDLGDVLLSSWLHGRRTALPLFGPPETRRIVEALLTQVYDKDIEFRVHEGINGVWPGVDTTDIMPGFVLQTKHWRITAERVDHGNRLDFPEAFKNRWICLGYRFECEDGVIAFSGDTVDCPGLRRLAQDADILVQCCYLARPEINSPQMERLAAYTLASADTVGRIAREAGVRRLVLTHHRQKPAEALEAMRDDVARDFPGDVLLGHDGLRVCLTD